TTWMQQIVTQLVFDGRPDVSPASISPWLDMTLPAEEEKFALLAAQTHRRIIKTHLPADALLMYPELKYIYIARDGRDVAWSFHNHMHHMTDEFYTMANALPGDHPPMQRPGPDVHAFFRHWLAEDGRPAWSFWENIRTWWQVRRQPNVLLLHYNELKADLAWQILRIADFLGIEVQPESFPRIVEHCSFDWMKAHADQVAPLGGVVWEGGGTTFIHRGTNGRWRDTLTAADIAQYEARALAELGPDCARWLATGGVAQSAAA
ncbi:MAG TPA: sulfotransferase domain-containing protein, partial [Paracoccaceae bacterium]|nr:sulfotransferase domain-containing protein [Paracoccaceae bacterium]